MFSSYAILCVFLRCIFYCLSQEVPTFQVYNSSLNLRENNRRDYDTQEHNLWLISRQDPIPAGLGGRWPPSSSESGQIVALRAADYDTQSAQHDLNNRETSLPLNNPQLVPSVLQYDRILTAENRRQSSNGGEYVVPNAEAVLVQLPIEITEGLWERPQDNLEYSINGRQNLETGNINIKFDELPVREKPSETPVIYPSVLQLTSRLPIPQGEKDIVNGENHEVQNQEFTRNGDYLNNSNTPTTLVSLPESVIRDVWLLRQDDQSTSSPQSLAEIPLYESYFTEPQSNGQNVHSIGSILTTEDIELLERLGILSSLIIEPVSPENVTRNFTSRENLEREYETEPVFIDNSGQSQKMPNKRKNTTLEDIVLIDIPQFTSADYHANIPENIGFETRGRQLPYSEDQSKNTPVENVKTNETSGRETNSSAGDKQLLEILEFFNLNVGDIFNLSLPGRIEKQTEPDQRSNSSEYSRNASFDKSQDSRAASKQASLNGSTSASDINISVRNATIRNNPPLRRNSAVLIPGISNGKIQPRLLDEQPAKENEIIERLIHKAVPVSERKLEMLKKLEIIPQPYFFGFRQDDGNGTLQHRNETSDNKGVVKGSYGYRDPMGVYRNVSYIADNNGFHAVVKTNEPGIVSHNTADAVFMSETPPLAALLKMMAYRRTNVKTNVTTKV